MRSTFRGEDVTILLKDITGRIVPQDTMVREKNIQDGGHYSEMIPIEYNPTDDYLNLYLAALRRFAPLTAAAVRSVSEKIYERGGGDVVLVSLARAGTPIGILIKRYIKMEYQCDWPHYTISIIRDKGIDKNALDYILERHERTGVQFVDGWTGKGLIAEALCTAMKEYPEVSAVLAVLSDPAGVTDLCGTHDDFLIPNSCLNATVAGLMSRTVLNSALIRDKDFHGAVFYENLIGQDRSYEFIDTVVKHFPDKDYPLNTGHVSGGGAAEVKKIAEEFNISDLRFIKPGIGEATRVLLRRLPEKLLVHSMDDEFNLGHIYQLAGEKKVPVFVYPLKNYRACAIIKELPR